MLHMCPDKTSLWPFSPAAVSANAPRHIRSHNRLIAGLTLEGHIHAILGGDCTSIHLGRLYWPRLGGALGVVVDASAPAAETLLLLLLLLLIITTWVSALLVFHTHTPPSRV